MAYAYRTALVTGASSGLGREFAEQAAAAGSDLILVARRANLLDELAAELGRRHGVAVEVLPADLADEQDITRVEERLAEPGRPVDLLVNNAGFDMTGRFAEVPADVQRRQLAVNVTAPIRLARAALPRMIKEQRGGILLVSSLVSALPMPGSALYGASKALLTAFGESLHMEAMPHGVQVTSVSAGLIRTNFHEVAGINTEGLPKAAWMEADAVARAGLAAISAGRVSVIPGRLNRIQAVYAKLAPRALLRAMTKRFLYRDVPATTGS
ncbi:SDR family oxidoreductase [Paractinoplanes ferrugineus]|uniref:Short-chain dehydrogenase n=1 Tax=Paractinoplanes ferrugineus TaxID=113564 RepID=A0A919JFG2_9ACTN|nr:SDR family oxidoreductase [Actinoplanes ferrugineus]GIE16221.1 short-chain dehydrogenase [Actinoplanes ferrugineus]